jgi:hypothetical protein
MMKLYVLFEPVGFQWVSIQLWISLRLIMLLGGLTLISFLGLVRLFTKHMDLMRLEKIEKKFDLFGIQTHPISLNPHGLRANRTSPYIFGWLWDGCKSY